MPHTYSTGMQHAALLYCHSTVVLLWPTTDGLCCQSATRYGLLATAGVESPVPVVNVQEFDSVIQVDNGQAVVLGGLIQDRVESVRTGVPVLSEMPLMGAAFRRQVDLVTKTELVVFLKATIVDGNNTVHNTDKDLYRTFSSDRRPFKL